MDEYAKANRLNWDNRAELHSTDTTGSYRIAKVLAGGSSLHALEAGEIGDIVRQGHRPSAVPYRPRHDQPEASRREKRHRPRFLAQGDRSARRDFARKAGADVRFVEASVYDAVEALGRTYDMVFVTWGAINWLDDIARWAKVVAALLRPGGKLYLLEGHPVMNQFDPKLDPLALELDWRTPRDKPLVWDDPQTYTGDARPLTAVRHYEWIHPIVRCRQRADRGGTFHRFPQRARHRRLEGVPLPRRDRRRPVLACPMVR